MRVRVLRGHTVVAVLPTIWVVGTTVVSVALVTVTVLS